MPNLKVKNGTEYWFISTLDGPWQIYSSVTSPLGKATSQWGIVNIVTGHHRKVNQASTKRANPYAKAEKLAEEFNSRARDEATRAGVLGYNRQYLREDIRRALLDCITMPGAHCYQGGVPAMVRRLEEINRVANNMLGSLDDNDMYEWLTHNVASHRSVLEIGNIDLAGESK
jgi:hypothetical protein